MDGGDSSKTESMMDGEGKKNLGTVSVQPHPRDKEKSNLHYKANKGQLPLVSTTQESQFPRQFSLFLLVFPLSPSPGNCTGIVDHAWSQGERLPLAAPSNRSICVIPHEIN